MSILVDSSVWVEYLRGDDREDDRLEWLIDEGLVVTNELILAELLPPLVMRKQAKLISLLSDLPSLKIIVNWQEIVDYQVTCLRNGINRVGIPDLIIAQNSKQNGVSLFTHDKHFRLMAKHIGIEVF